MSAEEEKSRVVILPVKPNKWIVLCDKRASQVLTASMLSEITVTRRLRLGREPTSKRRPKAARGAANEPFNTHNFQNTVG